MAAKKSALLDDRIMEVQRAFDYDKEVVDKGDRSSKLAVAHAKATWGNNPAIEILNQNTSSIPVIRPRKGYHMVTFTNGGNIRARSQRGYIDGAFEHADYHANKIGAETVAHANVLDFGGIDDALANPKDAYFNVFRNVNSRNRVMLAGETAVLRDVVTVPYNFTLTSIGFISDEIPVGRHVTDDGLVYVVFDPGTNVVTANSDGTGTKGDMNQQVALDKWKNGNRAGARVVYSTLRDVGAMLADDSIKRGKGTQIVALTCALEHHPNFPQSLLTGFNAVAREIGAQHGFEYILQPERMGKRIQGHGNLAYNIGGTAVCLNDEKYLVNTPTIFPGQVLMQIYNPTNPNNRSNGQTDIRTALYGLFGREDWIHATYADWIHATFDGLAVTQFAIAPSDILFSLYKRLFDEDAITWGTHMSGGSFRSRLGEEFQRRGLFADINKRDSNNPNHLHQPDPLMYHLMDFLNNGPNEAYAKWPMGVPGVVATWKPEAVEAIAHSMGFIAQKMGVVEQKPNLTGVYIRTPRGELVDYTSCASKK